MAVSFIAAAVLGIAIGLLSGLLGIGGGMVMVPMFRLAFGLEAMASTATSLFTIIPTSVSGVVSHVRNKTCIPKLGVAMGIGGACTSPLGVWLASISPSWGVMLAAALVIAYSAFSMIKKVVKPAAQKADDGGQPFVVTSRMLVMGLGIGLMAGVASGYVGLGGGFLMVPLMLSWLDLPMKKASGTSLVAIFILAIPGTIAQGMLGNIDYLVGIATAVGAIPGAFFGARLVSRVPERALRITFSAFLGVGAILLVVKEFALFG